MWKMKGNAAATAADSFQEGSSESVDKQGYQHEQVKPNVNS